MKKLMTGTAIALFTMAGAASAQEWSVNLRGYFVGGIGYVDIDDRSDDFVIARDTEIHIGGTLVADNGITFGFLIEFEGNDGSQQIDESSMFVSGSFGRFELGEQDGAKDRFSYTAYVNGPWASAGDGVGLLFDGAYFGNQSLNQLNGVGPDSGDSIKITYYTPSIAGFQAGVSFIPEDGLERPRAAGMNEEDEAWEFGAGYSGEFGEFSLAFGAGYYISGDDQDTLSLGASGGFGGFTLGVSYAMAEDAGFNGDDLDTMQVGATYRTGPWTFGGDVAFHLDEASVTTAPAVADSIGIVGGVPTVIPGTAATTVGAEQFGATAGFAYALAPGVSTGAAVEYLDIDVPGRDDAWAVGTWMRLAF